MKHFPFIISILFFAATPVLAWPFVKQDTSYGPFGFGVPVFFQADTTKPLEYTCGADVGHGLLSPPEIFDQFSYGDYVQGDPNVHFINGYADAGDIDGDGDVDIVRSGALEYGVILDDDWEAFHRSGDTRVMCSLNDGGGRYDKGWEFIAVDAPPGRPGISASFIKLADFDRDGDLDLLRNWEALRIDWNPGTGVFGGPATGITSDYDKIQAVETADFDGNGYQDIALMSQKYSTASPVLRVFYNQGGGVFTPLTLPGAPAGGDGYYGSLRLMDVDADGRTDLITGLNLIASGARLLWLQNTGEGFAAPVNLTGSSLMVDLTYGSDPPVPFPLATGDLDDDGREDLVILKGGHLLWLRSTGGGNFATSVAIDSQAGGYMTISGAGVRIGICDQDGDGDNDIFTGSAFYWNAPPHRAASAKEQSFTGTNPSGNVDLTTGDMNGDGRSDLVVADGGGKRLLWYPAGNGLTTPWTVSTGNVEPVGVAAADLDFDADTDLVWTSANTITRSMNSQGGIGWSSAPLAAMNGVTRVIAADCDGNSVPDILCYSPSASLLRWYRNMSYGSSWSADNVSATMGGVVAIAAGEAQPGGWIETGVVRKGSYGSFASVSTRSDTAWASQWTSTKAFGDSAAAVFADVLGQFTGSEIIFARGSNAIEAHRSDGNTVPIGTASGPVRQLVTADWDGNGYTDVIAAGDAGVEVFLLDLSHYSQLSPLRLSTTPARNIAMLSLDNDSDSDAVFTTTGGALRLLYNTSAQVTVSATSTAAVNGAPGAAASDALQISAVNNGLAPAFGPDDAAVRPGSLIVSFYRAEPQGSGFVPGSVMTAAEINAVVSGIRLNAGTLALTPYFAGLYAAIIPDSPNAWNTVPIGATVTQSVSVILTATADTAPVTKFYISLAGSTWYPLNPAGTISGPAALTTVNTGFPASSLVQVTTRTPLQQWRQTNFGTYNSEGTAANDADPDGDGTSNLVEYIIGRNPGVRETGVAAPPLIVTQQGYTNSLMAGTRILDNFDPKVKITLEDSTDLQAWGARAWRTGSTDWTGAAPVKTTLMGGRSKLTFTTSGKPSTHARYYVRLKAEELP